MCRHIPMLPSGWLCIPCALERGVDPALRRPHPYFHACDVAYETMLFRVNAFRN